MTVLAFLRPSRTGRRYDDYDRRPKRLIDRLRRHSKLEPREMRDSQQFCLGKGSNE
jgi:hypothetical protein